MRPPKNAVTEARAASNGANPTAVFCANDLLAVGVMSALRGAGISIPNDVSVIGFDDIPLAAQMPVPLTTIRQPMDELGAAGRRASIVRPRRTHTAPDLQPRPHDPRIHSKAKGVGVGHQAWA